MKDQTKISNADSEIQHAAKVCDVPAYVIHLAKHQLQTNDRELIYAWVKSYKGIEISVKF